MSKSAGDINSSLRCEKIAKSDKDNEVALTNKINEGKLVRLHENGIVDWTQLDDDLVIEIFSRLNNLDRGSLSSTCKSWRTLGSSSSLWQSLDVRSYQFYGTRSENLSSRCENLFRLIFNDAPSDQPIMSLGARNLKEIVGYGCKNLKDSTLSAIVAGHPLLQTLQLGPDLCKNVSSYAIRTIADSCPNLRKLKLSGIRDIEEGAINALASRCKHLIDISFIDCITINEQALGNVLSLRFLSVAGTKNINWVSVCKTWSELPNLIGLDISRTKLNQKCVHWLLSSSSALKVLCAFGCPLLPSPAKFNNVKISGKKLLCDASDMYQWIISISNEKERKEIHSWLECILSLIFLRHHEVYPIVTRNFWYEPVALLLFTLVKSKQEHVVETVMRTISNLEFDEGELNAKYEGKIPPIGDEEIGLLLYHCRSHKECLQLEATKAIVSLMADVFFCASMVKLGGIYLIVDLTKSKSGLLVEEAVRGLFYLSVWAGCQCIFIDTGVVKALIGVLSVWSYKREILLLALATLRDLAYHEKYAIEIQGLDGVKAVLALASGSPFTIIIAQALCVVANLSRHGNEEYDYIGIGKETGVIGSLVKLTQSSDDDIRLEAVTALSTLCCYEGYSKPSIAAGVIEAFVALTGPGNSPAIQNNAAVFFWKFSRLKENSFAICDRKGIAALIKLTRSDFANVGDNAAAALCNLALLHADQIEAEEGVGALLEFYELTESEVAEFYSILALACICERRNWDCDRRLKDFWFAKNLALYQIGNFIETVCDPEVFSRVAATPTPSNLEICAKGLVIEESRQFRVNNWAMDKLIIMLCDPCYTIKSCAAFALVQLIAPGNIYRLKHTKYVQEFEGLEILSEMDASGTDSDIVNVLLKVLLFCLEQNQREMELESGSSVERMKRKRKRQEC